ncbi:MAG: hypothetical protein IJR14_00125 [Synergistaceae bacterium]|nr:hypothetical protein [Synergistaceae bacterium]
MHILRLERQCITMAQHLKSEDSKLLDDQLSLSGEAEVSFRFLQDTERYRQHIDVLFPNGVRDLPRREGMYTFVNSQTAHLRSGKSHFTAQESARTEFYSARELSLHAALNTYKHLQRTALFPAVVSVELEVRALAREMGIDDPKIWAEPRTDGQDYKGEIVHVDEERGYLVQHNGKKSLFVHQLDRLSKTPEIGENVKVSYPKDQEQKATVETVERQRSRSARR